MRGWNWATLPCPEKEKPSKVLDGTLLLKLGLDNSSVSNLVKIGLPGRKALGQTQECGIEGGKSQPPGTGLAWSGPPLEGLVFGFTDLALPHPTWQMVRLVLCAGTW